MESEHRDFSNFVSHITVEVVKSEPRASICLFFDFSTGGVQKGRKVHLQSVGLQM